MEIPELAQYAKLFEENRTTVEQLLQAKSDEVLVELGTHPMAADIPLDTGVRPWH